ncbi:hypothetical protein BO94DRAFT_317739 [Aspergillus sclerotioniger CBS 115572]|uniref:DUF3752 domain-containing protein n=1 Tax=Aspergillus sclerotioniger CBS 115572 TaxID=1450535 RepID=A0A317X8T0_9EURO|nr:hypothetical protein BO94DRAFT_317739 [Aspergillus sclerotioniger CBS 115572]PWY94042.1 hypothetical protein BO94DRAFT_317739 [Aspergillus sclerotioniger CBS 115572]
MESEKRKYAAGPSLPSDSEDASKRRRVIGPAFPPPADAADNSSSSDSSDDDDFGPSLPPPEGSLPSTTSSQPTPTPSSETSTAPKAPQRDAWMLEPIDGSNRSSRVDPTKLRNRKFQTGRAANTTPGGGGVDVSWTETPEQKMKRLQDEVLGVQTRPGAAVGTGDSGARGAQPSRAMQEKILRYNEEKRKGEKAEQAARDAENGKKKEEEDDPSARAFDKEKDMSLSSKITNAQRREMMNKAADFGSRFTSGKFL